MTCYKTTTPYAANYRQGVGLIVKNKEQKLLFARRLDHSTPSFDALAVNEQGWQFPQGGIDSGEAPHQAAERELMEEIGTNFVSLLRFTEFWYSYDLPSDLSPVLWGGRFKGQTQKWFLFDFFGKDCDINLTKHQQEFSTWKWVEPQEALDSIVSFKKQVYEVVLKEFKLL